MFGQSRHPEQAALRCRPRLRFGTGSWSRSRLWDGCRSGSRRREPGGRIDHRRIRPGQHEHARIALPIGTERGRFVSPSIAHRIDSLIGRGAVLVPRQQPILLGDLGDRCPCFERVHSCETPISVRLPRYATSKQNCRLLDSSVSTPIRPT
jgi:hypothetical protein